VHEVHEGGNVDAEGGGGQDFDWLEEGFEGPDFDDDVFGNVDDRPSTHEDPAPHRPSEGDDGPSTHKIQQPHIGLLQLTMTHLLKRVNGLTHLLKMTWKV